MERLSKKSIKKAIQGFCYLGGYQLQEIANLRKYSKDRIVYAGIDLLNLQDAILKLPDRALEAVSCFGYNEPYHKSDLEYGIAILRDTLKLY